MRSDVSLSKPGRRLAREAARLRADAEMPSHEAARRLRISQSKLSRMETGVTAIRLEDLLDMIEVYGVEAKKAEPLIKLCRDARLRGWWTDYRDVFTGSYIALEYEAARIRVNATLVPGFLQTERYARAIISSTGPQLGNDEVERRVEARLARQAELLARADPPVIQVILDESILRRQIGGPEVAREQLEALLEANERPNVAIRVMPDAAGGHAGLTGEFVILDFEDPEQDPPVAYEERLSGETYLEAPQDIDRYLLAFTLMLKKALSPAQSVNSIRKIVKEGAST